MQTKYPSLWERTKNLFIAFPTYYLLELGFSAVQDSWQSRRNKLMITDHGDLRLLLTNSKPDIDNLISSHQTHSSH
ncbi:hypothetical protein RRG08_007634 [Elysia crispata]|uniref:HAT C-terminal dimerisation domain-containing protein n=1 Tax=Elysia crispata TaxID=231223 RepID=A0AAE0Y461_9GAST|nr:hypothetical protein RRG08_007634 [Elysia crispata]